ncbi:hypothetical protein LCGC14_0887150 [marine sediment metagenome]|uniref:Uncharacterized protein n=1 Tax=marine sediment metagenome TaxID=412755 RepID=A0A0F9P552_9ZZZZ
MGGLIALAVIIAGIIIGVCIAEIAWRIGYR